MIVFSAITGATVVTQRARFARQIVNYILLQAVLIWCSYLLEMSSRRLFRCAANPIEDRI